MNQVVFLCEFASKTSEKEDDFEAARAMHLITLGVKDKNTHKDEREREKKKRRRTQKPVVK